MATARTGRRRLVPGSVAALLAATLTLAWLTKARCLLTDASWQAGEQYLGWCYTDIYPLWFVERLNEGAVPYLETTPSSIPC